MTRGIEPRDRRNDQPIVEQLSHRETARTLTEVSVAALTTEPELHAIGRSLITLARYYTSRTQPALSRLG